VNLRGLAGTLNQLFLVIGGFITNIAGLPQLFGTKDLWPVLVGFVLIPVFFLFTIKFVLFYLKINK
jgi:hypothetical protein